MVERIRLTSRKSLKVIALKKHSIFSKNFHKLSLEEVETKLKSSIKDRLTELEAAFEYDSKFIFYILL